VKHAAASLRVRRDNRHATEIGGARHFDAQALPRRFNQPTRLVTMDASDPRIELLWRQLAKVIDPEIGLDIVTLGLVYGVELHDDVAWITHTLTTRGCPMERLITDGIRAAALQVDDVCGVETTLVWEPAWHSGMIAPGVW
jgi:metal-sulfur cluster biosynthetic enzyme